MRKIKRLSPTSLNIWESNRELFYTKYLSDAKPEWEPQSAAMIVGSAFDAFVKCHLHHHIFGNDGDGEYKLENLFEEQCTNPDLKVWAWEAGKYIFERYRFCGCYDEILDELLQSEEDPRFEFAIEGKIEGIPVLGKPDMWYKKNVQVVLDWKVMGYCSKYSTSPKKFYKCCRDSWNPEMGKPTRGGKGAHKKYKEIDHKGHKIGGHWLEQVDKKWADQIALYSWLLDVEIGNEDMVTGIDQLACKPGDPNPLIRVAQHRCRISKEWQLKLLERLKDCWETIHSGHIFTDLTREESDARCEVLDMQQPENDEFWTEVNKQEYRG